MSQPPSASSALSILDSLTQSRQTLLRSAFTPFPSPAPPHTLTFLAPAHSVTLSIGPLYFPSSSLWLAEWAAPAPDPAATTLGGVAGPVSPAVMARINAAAHQDPNLAALVRRAAEGAALPDELTGLQRYVDSLRAELGEPAGGAAGGGEAPPPSIVFEFNENPGVRFLLPAHVFYTPLVSGTVPLPLPPSPTSPGGSGKGKEKEQGQGQGQGQDVLLSFFLFPSERPALVQRYKQRLRALPPSLPDAPPVLTPPTAPVPVDVVVHDADQGMREGLWKASRNARRKSKAEEQEVEGWYKQMLSAVPLRTHVQHLPPPSLLSATDSPAPGDPSLSRMASEPALSASVGASAGTGAKRGGTPVVEKAAPATKKQKTAPKKKGSRAPARSRSKASASASATPIASTPLAASPSPSLGAPGSAAGGSPAPEPAAAAVAVGKKPPARAKRASARSRGGVKYEEESE
ncbi:hypothetical protein JCM8097_003980 [Rhodosporidiobolus ruineniae]